MFKEELNANAGRLSSGGGGKWEEDAELGKKKNNKKSIQRNLAVNSVENIRFRFTIPFHLVFHSLRFLFSLYPQLLFSSEYLLVTYFANQYPYPWYLVDLPSLA